MKTLAVLAAFVVLAAALTFPLALHFTTAIAGPPADGFIHLYEMHWFRRAIFELHVWPLFNPEVFYPFGYNLALSHITPSNTVPMMPIVLLAGPVAGFNGAVLLSFILSGFGAYLLVYRLTRQRWAGLLAGMLFAFSPYRVHNLGAGWLPNLGTQWLPFALLYVDRLLAVSAAGVHNAGTSLFTAQTQRAQREAKSGGTAPVTEADHADVGTTTHRSGPRVPNSGRARLLSALRNGALAGFFFALVCLSSWYHVYIAGVAIAVFVLARGWPWRRRLVSAPSILGLAAFALIAALMVLPLALPLLQYGASEQSDIQWPLIEADDASASLDDLLLPSAYHSLWGDAALQRRQMTYAAVVPGLVYLGLPALLLGLAAIRRRAPAARSFLLVGLVGAVLTLGLTLHVNGLRIYVPVPSAVEEAFSRAMLTLAGRLALNPGAYWPFRAENGIPLPLPGMLFSLFMPFGSTMRVFHRFGMDSSLGFAVLAGLGAAALLPRPGRRQVVAIVLLLAFVVVDFLPVPLVFGRSDATGFAVDHWLAEQPGDFAVLHLPLARALTGPGLYRAAIHGKKISYGYGTFFPTAWRVAIGRLTAFPDQAGLQTLRSWNVRYVLIGEGAYRAGLVDVKGDTWEKVEQRLRGSPGVRYVRTFDEPSPVSHDVLSPRLGKPWPVVPVVADRTHVYEILPP